MKTKMIIRSRGKPVPAQSVLPVNKWPALKLTLIEDAPRLKGVDRPKVV